MVEVSDELLDSISKLYDVLIDKDILDEEEIVTGIEIIDITTNHINTIGRFGDIP